MSRRDNAGARAGWVSEFSMTKEVRLLMNNGSLSTTPGADGGQVGTGVSASLLVRPVPRSMRKLVTAMCAVVGLGITMGVGPALAAGSDRAYELVSPPDKAGNSVDVRQTVQSSRGSGDAVAFSSTGAFGDASGAVTGAYYVSRRSSDAWTTHAVDAPQENPDAQIGLTSSFLSDDLSKTFQFSHRALLPGAVPGGSNAYISDNLTGARELVAGTTDRALAASIAVVSVKPAMGASVDMSHMVFQTYAQLLPEATPNTNNIYEYADGHLRLVNVLPDGTVASDAFMGSNARDARPVSADGSRVFFTSYGGELYARVNGSVTVPISVSQRAGDPATPVSVSPEARATVSRDGNVVYFVADAPLTEDAVPGGATRGDLYRYDFRTGKLTDESTSDPAQPAAVQRVNAVSENGEYAYFSARNALTPDAISNAPNFYVSHHGGVKLVAILGGPEVGGPFFASTSPSGRYIAFPSSGKLTDGDNTNPACKNDPGYTGGDGVCIEVYLYDAVTGKLQCVSCDTVDGLPRFADIGAINGSISGYAATVVSDEGQVFFNSDARLVSEDSNGVRDVYEWDGQRASLISPGRGPASMLAEVSRDGRDVFFFTEGRLVAQDIDNAFDLYDARVGGGLSSQNEPPTGPAPCVGDGCQGGLTPAQELPEVPTAGFAGRGNVAPDGVVKPKVSMSGPTSVRGSSLLLKVKVSAAGRISLSGSRLVAVSRSVGKAGSYQLRVALTARAKKALRTSKRLKVSVRVSYLPKSGARVSASRNVTFKS
jgi:hypothetical protein